MDVGPHRKYFIRLASGRIFTRNRRFIRRRYAYTLPTLVEPLHQLSATAEPFKVPLRRLTRHAKKPDRLIETIQRSSDYIYALNEGEVYDTCSKALGHV